MSPFRGPLFALHAIFATVLILALLFHLNQRTQDVSRLSATTMQEHQETLRLSLEVDRQRALLHGLSVKDPYVIELLARDRLPYSQPGELSPPPAPTIDKLRSNGSK